MFDFVLFGIVDNLIMIIGFFCGVELGEKLLPVKFRSGLLGGVLGAGLGNAVSDFAGGLASFNLPLAFGTGLGCLIGLIVIPLIVHSKWINIMSIRYFVY